MGAVRADHHGAGEHVLKAAAAVVEEDGEEAGAEWDGRQGETDEADQALARARDLAVARAHDLDPQEARAG